MLSPLQTPKHPPTARQNKQRADRKRWLSKLVVKDPVFYPHHSADTRKAPSTLDCYSGVLADEPKKRGIKFPARFLLLFLLHFSIIGLG